MSRFGRRVDLSIYDLPCGVRGGEAESASAQNEQIRAMLLEIREQIDRVPFWRRVKVVNELMEGSHVPNVASAADRGLAITKISPTITSDGAVVSGEWITGQDTDPGQRLLFVHGGGFVGGSPKGHRPLTMRLAEVTGMAVCSVQYRMFPKHRRYHGLADVRAAYDWVLSNGPGGEQGECDSLVVSGDSAGGNLGLMLLQWARDNDRRPADACVAFSPVVDVGLGSPSCQTGFEDDLILGHFFRRILRVPRMLRYPLTDGFHGGLPGSGRWSHPDISPLYGDLHDLPPTLIQASEHELLRGDANRYTNKAREAGSQVEYQTWPEMVHVFQMFSDTLPEGREAMNLVGEFVGACIPRLALAQ